MKKLFTIIISSLLLLTFAMVSCEKEDLGTASIYGIVTDKATGEPIKSAGVELLPVGLKTITGTDGRFEFANLKAGSYQVYITQAGYVEVISSNIELSQGQSLQRDVQMELLPSYSTATVTTQPVTNIVRSEGRATFTGVITHIGEPEYTERGFVYATVRNPSIETDSKLVVKGKGLGEFTGNVSGLVLGKTYYVRAYAKNLQGTAYGNEVVADFNAILPEVETTSVTLMSETKAYFIGKILKSGDPTYTERGFIYGTMQNPTIDDISVTKVVASNTTSNQFEKEVVNVNFAHGKYYVRAYAKSSAGVVYGKIITMQDPEYADYLALPTFIYSGRTYHVYPDMGALAWDTAISACEALTYAGYDDWYLPNKSELNAMYINKSEIGGFSYNWYWSSTEVNGSTSGRAWNQSFSDGDQEYDSKSISLKVRCVRRD